MIITLYTAQMVLEVRQKSHLNVQDIQDPEARDNARAGLDKSEEITRCVRSAFGELTSRVSRFLNEEYTMEGDNASAVPPAYVYDMELTVRRGSNKEEALTQAMSAFVVNLALAKFCATVNQTERSNNFSLAALDYGRQIDTLLYTKHPPIVA